MRLAFLSSSTGALPDPCHYDLDSLLTLDIMLSDTRTDFQGGQLLTKERAAMGLQSVEPEGHHRETHGQKGGQPMRVDHLHMKGYTFEQGDALCFVSHKYHCVTPVTKGLRQVLVLEFWRGEERTCGHRCETLHGACKKESLEAQTAALTGLERIRDEEARTGRMGAAVPAHPGQEKAQQPSQEEVEEVEEEAQRGREQRGFKNEDNAKEPPPSPVWTLPFRLGAAHDRGTTALSVKKEESGGGVGSSGWRPHAWQPRQMSVLWQPATRPQTEEAAPQLVFADEEDEAWDLFD